MMDTTLERGTFKNIYDRRLAKRANAECTAPLKYDVIYRGEKMAGIRQCQDVR